MERRLDEFSTAERQAQLRARLAVHGKKVLVKENYQPRLGKVIMIGNNAGFSTGPHPQTVANVLIIAFYTFVIQRFESEG